jgi:hypothetical protein
MYSATIKSVYVYCSFNSNMIYCCMLRAVTRLWHSKQLIRLIMIAHETKEHAKSAVTSRNNMRAAVFSARSVWPLYDAAIEELLRELFSVGSAPRLYHSTDQAELS